MASKYAIAAGGTWTSDTTWSTTSGGANDTTAPTAADDVFLDGSSGNVTLSGSPVCRSLNMTSYGSTLTHNASVTLTIGDATAGASSIALKLAGTYTLGSTTTSAISFVSTSATQQTVDWGGKTCGNVTFNGAGGSWIFSANGYSGAAATFTLTAGSLDTANLALSCGRLTCSGSSTRSLTLGTSTVTCAINFGGTIFDTGGSNLTFSGASSTINITGNAVNFGTGAVTYGTVNITGTNVCAIIGVNGATFGTLTRTGTAAVDSELTTSVNFSATTLTITGNSASYRCLFRSNTLGTARTITIGASGATASANADFRDITLSTTNDLSAITGRSGDCGGNTGITCSGAADRFWVANAGNWHDATNHWATTSGGSPGAANYPLPQDTAKFNASSFSSGVQTVTMDEPRYGSIDCTGISNSPTLSRTVSGEIYGSLTLASAMTWTGSAATTTTFRGRGTHIVTSAGKTWNRAVAVDSISGTLTCADAFTVDATITFTLTSGTFSGGGFNLSFGLATVSGSTTRTFTPGAGTLTFSGVGSVWTATTTTGLTYTAGGGAITFSDTSASDKTFIGGGLQNYGPLASNAGTGRIIFTGANRFDAVVWDNTKVTLPAGSTTTIDSLAGTSMDLISSSAGSPATLSCPTDISCVGASIKDSTVTGGAGTYEILNGTNVSGNTGWTFLSGTVKSPDAAVLTITSYAPTLEFGISDPPASSTSRPHGLTLGLRLGL